MLEAGVLSTVHGLRSPNPCSLFALYLIGSAPQRFASDLNCIRWFDRMFNGNQTLNKWVKQYVQMRTTFNV